MMLDNLSTLGSFHDVSHVEALGRWSPIRFVPDMVTGEVLNLGVAYIDPEGRVHARLLDRLDGVQCLYQGRLAPEDVSFLLKAIKSALPKRVAATEEITVPSPHVFFGDWQPAQAMDPPTLLDALFTQMVTLARRASTFEDQERADSVATPAFRRRVFDEMRKRSDWAEKIIAEQNEWVIGESFAPGRKRVLDMPLRGRQRFGTIVSAAYKSPGTRQLHLLRAHSDLEAAIQVHPNDKAGIFILRPYEGQVGFPSSVMEAVDRDIDELAWKLGLHGKVTVEAEEDPGRIAEQILEWAHVA